MDDAIDLCVFLHKQLANIETLYNYAREFENAT